MGAANETGAKNDYEEQQAQKQAAREAAARRARVKKIAAPVAYWLVGLVLLLGGGWFVVRRFSPQGPDLSQAVEILGRDHIAEGATYNRYNSNPPTSGPHYAEPAKTGFYDQELADEQLVHNLEHGHIWVAYQPNLPPAIIKTLRALAGGKVIVTPRAKNDTALALAAWGRLDKFSPDRDVLDIRRVKDFILRYQNKGPEK